MTTTRTEGIKYYDIISIRTEADRKQEAIRFCKKRIESLDRDILDCDYAENPDGELIFEPGCYSEEKELYQYEKRKWQAMLDILTQETPFRRLGEV